MRSAALLLVLTAATAPALSASEPDLVSDINPVPLGVGSEPERFLPVADGRVVFAADDGFVGNELWGSDGTEAGTVLLADTCPGPCSGQPGLRTVTSISSNGAAVAAVFEAWEETGTGSHLWWTDGTPAGILRLTQRPVQIAFDFNVWVAELGLFFFVVDDPAAGRELWVSEVRRGSARRLLDLWPGAGKSPDTWLRSFGGRAYFFRDDGVSGPNLWTSDGTAAGTRLVKDTWPRSASHGAPVKLTVAGIRLFYVAASPERGYDLWRSDGTAAGTVPVSDLVPGPDTTRFGHLAAVGNRLFFEAQLPRGGQEMWVSDGTARGTRRLTNFRGDSAFSSLTYRTLPPNVLGDRLVFQADDSVHGVEPWVSDGTPAGTVLLRDVCPGPCRGAGLGSWVRGGRIFFEGTNPRRGSELWVSNGTPAGTQRFRGLCRGGACSTSPSFPAAVEGGLLLFARSPQGVPQLWRTDGTPRGTVLIRDFPSGIQSYPMPVRGGVLFAMRDPEHGVELWRSDGTPAGTAILKDINTAQW